MKFLRALSTSLQDDPFYRAITVGIATGQDRLSALDSYFHYSAAEGTRRGRVVVAPHEEDGAAIWLLPQSEEAQARESQAKASFLLELLGRRGSDSYHRIVEFMAPRARRLVPQDAWYLSIIGIRPAAQGKGLGAHLVRSTLAEADAAGKVSYLETFSRRNVAFYERLGFRTVAEQAEPTTMHSYLIMRRDGRAN